MVTRRTKKTVEYDRVEKDIRRLILSGDFAEEAALPGELQLSTEYGVSRKTIRKALENLRTQNYIRKHHGSGNFVISARERANMQRIAGKIRVMLPDGRADTPFTGELLAGIYKYAAVSSMHISISSHEVSAAVLLETYHNFECDGFIWGSLPEEWPETISEFARMKIPQVIINGKVSGAGAVLYDSLPAWRSLLNIFHACGHRKIAFIDRPEKHFWIQQRKAAFLKAAVEYHLDSAVFQVDYAAKAEITAFLKDHPEITAYVVVKPHTDAFLQVAAAIGKKLPDEISWAEFTPDDISLVPETARIHIPAQKMGCEAVRLLSSHNFFQDSDPERMVPCFTVAGLSIVKHA